MKKAEEKRIGDLAEFDQEVSLYQLIPAGSGRALRLLRYVVDYILNNHPDRIPSIILTGEQGVPTHARCYLRALGIEDIRLVDGFFVQTGSNLAHYFRNHSRNTGYILANMHQLDRQIQAHILDILSQRQFALFNYLTNEKELYPVGAVLVLTAPQITQVPESIRKTIDYHVEIEPYTHDQKILLGLQRIKYCRIGYQSEKVLEEIVLRANGNLRQMVQLLQIGITLISLEGRTILELKDIKKSADLSPPPIQSKS